MSPTLCLVVFEDCEERNRVASRLWALDLEVRRVSSADMALRLLKRGRPIDVAIVESAAIVVRARNEGIETPFVVVPRAGREPGGSLGIGWVRFVEPPLDEADLGAVVAELLGARSFRRPSLVEARALAGM